MPAIEKATEPRLMNDMNGALERADTLLSYTTQVLEALEGGLPTTATSERSPSPNNLTGKFAELNETLKLAIDKALEAKQLLL